MERGRLECQILGVGPAWDNMRASKAVVGVAPSMTSPACLIAFDDARESTPLEEAPGSGSATRNFDDIHASHSGAQPHTSGKDYFDMSGFASPPPASEVGWVPDQSLSHASTLRGRARSHSPPSNGTLPGDTGAHTRSKREPTLELSNIVPVLKRERHVSHEVQEMEGMTFDHTAQSLGLRSGVPVATVSYPSKGSASIVWGGSSCGGRRGAYDKGGAVRLS